MDVRSREAAPPFEAPDGSEIRELAHPRTSGSERQSLAEATIPPGAETREHCHPVAEEIYAFQSGAGVMRLGEAEAPVGAGDTVVIPPGTPHKLRNDGDEPLVLLCCCSPPYSDEDTVFTEPERGAQAES
jgi:mannose-6-phosphate isomerase-like protein (cupin superfamily)